MFLFCLFTPSQPSAGRGFYLGGDGAMGAQSAIILQMRPSLSSSSDKKASQIEAIV